MLWGYGGSQYPADHGRRAEAGTAVSGRADLWRGYRRAGLKAADGDGHAGEHTGGSDAGGAGESLLRRRRAHARPRADGGQAAARLLRCHFSGHGHGALLRNENERPARPLRAGVRKHCQGREGRVYRDDAHQHQPPAPPSAHGAAALFTEDRRPAHENRRHGLLSRRPDRAGACPAHGKAAGEYRH